MRRFFTPLLTALLLGVGGLMTSTPAFAEEGRQRPLLEILDKVASGAPAPEPAPASAPEPAPAPVAPEPAPPAPEAVVAVDPAPKPTPSSTLGDAITLADIPQQHPSALPQQQAGKQWKPVRFHTEVRSRPNDLTIDAKAELVTQNGWMFGIQHVNSSGEFRDSNATDSFSGKYIDTRSEVWAGRHWASQDGRTRGAVNAFVRQLTYEDSGKGQSLPGVKYPYSYTWKNSPKPITQLGVRARGEHDLIRTESQQLTVHLEGEAAGTVSGQSGWAYDIQTGVWYRTAQVEAYAEAGDNNTGFYASGNGRYYLTKGGQLRPFVEAGGETGSGYSNLRVGGGLQIGLGNNVYTEFTGGGNFGTSGDGGYFIGRGGIRF